LEARLILLTAFNMSKSLALDPPVFTENGRTGNLDASSHASESVGYRPGVCVLGASLDVDNRGVLALGVSVAQLFAAASPGAPLSYLYGNSVGGRKRITGGGRDIEIAVRNCRASPRSAPNQHILVILAAATLYRIGIRGPARRNPWLRALLEARVIGDIRGGDSFSDIYGFRKFVLGSLALLSVALLGRPYVMLPQTYGPFKLRSSRRLAAHFLRRASAVFTRDRNCTDLVVSLCGRTPTFCPDVAFTLQPERPKSLSIAPEGLDLAAGDVVIGVNVSGLLYVGGYTGRNMFGLRDEYSTLMDHLVDGLLRSTSAKILLVPHVFGSESEEEACEAILHSASARHAGRVFRIANRLTEREVKWAIGKTDFFIGSRMHACIAALSQFVPAVGLAYSDKFLGVFESAGVGSAILDLRRAGATDVLRDTLAAFARRVEIRNELRRRIPPIQHQVVETFRGLMSPDHAA
jgi:colanic acid/amylovoran biosynthesis protein